MRSPVAVAEYPQPAVLGCNSLDEDTRSLCSSEHVPRFCPVAGAYPSPYRASTAAAFADINRALDVRSLRNSVYADFQANQTPPKAKKSPRTSLKPLSLSRRRADSNAPNPHRPAHLADMRSHSLPERPSKKMSSESESEQLMDGDDSGTCTVQSSRTDCTVPGGGGIVAGDQVRFHLSELGENRPSGRKDAHKSTRRRATDAAVTSPKGKIPLKRTRATTCLIM